MRHRTGDAVNLVFNNIARESIGTTADPLSHEFKGAFYAAWHRLGDRVGCVDEQLRRENRENVTVEMTRAERDQCKAQAEWPTDSEPKTLYGFKIRVLSYRDERRSRIFGVDTRLVEGLLRMPLRDVMTFPVLDVPDDCEFDGPYLDQVNRRFNWVVSHGSFDVVPDGEMMPMMEGKMKAVRMKIEDA